MPTTILEQTRTHPPRRGTGRHGQDVWEFDIPAGEQLAAVELAVEEAGLDSGARIASAAAAGTVGHGRAEISWWYSTGNAVRYRIKVTTEPQGVRVLESTRFKHGPYAASGASGIDQVVVALPDGFSLQSVDIIFVQRRRGGASFRRGNPGPGSTGSPRFFVLWNADRLGGMVEYFLRVTALPSGPIAFRGNAPEFVPPEGVGGSDLTVKVSLENIGTVAVSKFMLKGDFYAVSLDSAVGQAFLQWATDEQRTSRQGETVDVTITPGQRRTVSSNPRTLPSSLGPFQGPAGQILNPSSKGDYLVTVSVEAITTNASGDEVKTQVYSQQVPFKIVA
jgi:hypothetical protein